MKKAVFILVCLLALCAVATAEELADIVPDASLWGMSMDEIKLEFEEKCETCQVGDDEALRAPDAQIGPYNMGAFFVFDEKTVASDGSAGLTKIAYILNDSGDYTQSELDKCYQTLLEGMKAIAGEPDSEKSSAAVWKNDAYKIEIGKGKLEKYTGNDYATVAMIFKKPGPQPTEKPKATPRPTRTPQPTRTPKPEYAKLDYKAVSRHPENYDGRYVKFTGIVVQSQETFGIEYEGGNPFDSYYILRVASKYKRFKYTDGYDTDDIVYVVVPVKAVEGGRILDDDKIQVYGRCDGIETYTTVLGAAVSIPRVEADRVVID